ncbi:hypothetical protein B0H63DRAFT_528291 [Podospora didyma]|uniref:Amine oxidase domain-containing protein n=1 Tax=Podospora didyma TaxID=330526 RepID=A0AAE0N528_9PEZI|nr:hypothetical protein B0H63DRAFT_528291 [Podospora didyma]
MAQLSEAGANADLPPFSVPGLRAAYAKHLLDKYLRQKHARVFNRDYVGALPHVDPIPVPGDVDKSHGDLGTNFTGRICIVGAGVSGLFTAMILKYIGIDDFDILEASDRVGGRVYTYEFPDDPNCPHNYYDIGAMRIPEIETMQSTLALIQLLGLEEQKVKYIYDNEDAPTLWWYKHQTPDGTKFNNAVQSVVAPFLVNWENAFENYMQGTNDNYSTRAWLMLQADPKLTYEDTVMGEASDTSTGLFDQAFTETICDYCDFAAAKTSNWWRLEGGMSVVTDRMQQLLASETWPRPSSQPHTIKLNTPVIAMADTGKAINVTTTDPSGNNPTTTAYDFVFNTTAMAPLQRMDISGLHLPDSVLTGIRALSYDRATKVAIKFASPWWKILGGVSSTDLPISNVVYPSWDDGPDKPSVLMVSYSWAQDATRMGALTPAYNSQTQPTIHDPVVAVCLESLVKLFADSPDPPTLAFLRDQYITHHAFAWSHDQFTGGAFALFGPGQFKHMYPQFQEIFCGGKFAMSGEALSAHHAWISGALDSAYLTVLTWLVSAGLVREAAELKASALGAAKGQHPAEVDEALVHWAARLSGKGGRGEKQGQY